mgnify:CR=1 FL=1
MVPILVELELTCQTMMDFITPPRLTNEFFKYCLDYLIFALNVQRNTENEATLQ